MHINNAYVAEFNILELLLDITSNFWSTSLFPGGVPWIFLDRDVQLGLWDPYSILEQTMFSCILGVAPWVSTIFYRWQTPNHCLLGSKLSGLVQAQAGFTALFLG